MISVRDAMKLPIMEKTKIVAGLKGIDKKIKWVTIVEVLEDIDRIQDGEFLITTGFNLMENKKSLDVFHDLLRLRPLSGVAIYTSFYMKKIPESFIELADRHHLPLIEIPTDINFSEITKEILEKIINKQTRLLEQSEKIHRELTTLILNDQNLTEVTNRLAQLTNSNIYIFNEFYQISYTNTDIDIHETTLPHTTFMLGQHQFDITKHLLRSMDIESKEHITMNNISFTIFPIIAKLSCFGWIVMKKREEHWQELDDIAIERATSIYAMEFLKKRAVEEAQLRIQSNLLEDIFNKNYTNERIIEDQGLKLNYDFSLPQTVFHLSFKQAKNVEVPMVDRLYHIVEQLFIQKNKQHIIQTKLQSITFLTNINGKTTAEQRKQAVRLAEEILKDWKYDSPKLELIIGIGRVYEHIPDLGKSAREARNAVTLSELIHRATNIVHYNDLGMYDLLLTMNRKGMKLAKIYEESISGLLNEGESEIDLIKTIDVYFKNNQSIQRSSEELFIHRHTLRYRLNQIEQRTGLDLKCSDDLIKLQFGVMAYKLHSILKKGE